MKNKLNTILERRSVGIPLNAVIFLTHFLLVSYLWRQFAPDLTGLGRLTLCWLAASGLTWMTTSLARGVVRLVLAIILLGLLVYITSYYGT